MTNRSWLSNHCPLPDPKVFKHHCLKTTVVLSCQLVCCLVNFNGMQPMFKIHVNVAEGERNKVILCFNTFSNLSFI